ncbi:hypothetical protein COCOBI_06-6780 [Coccomyxa sp. Obi]|nr:hypothetical protein COCOBI_06-6780 [Coccomyxa sp. Obi]
MNRPCSEKKVKKKQAAQQLAASWQTEFKADIEQGKMPEQFQEDVKQHQVSWKSLIEAEEALKKKRKALAGKRKHSEVDDTTAEDSVANNLFSAECQDNEPEE